MAGIYIEEQKDVAGRIRYFKKDLGGKRTPIGYRDIQLMKQNGDEIIIKKTQNQSPAFQNGCAKAENGKMELSIAQKVKIQKMKHDGKSVVAIAEKLKLDRSVVSDILKQAGFQNGSAKAEKAINNRLMNAGVKVSNAQSPAYKEGKQVGLKGGPWKENPYGAGKENEGLEWDRGWDVGHRAYISKQADAYPRLKN